MPSVATDNQLCPQCGEWKPLDDFPPSCRGCSGSWCRACHREKVCGSPTERACDGCGVILTVTARRAALPRIFHSRQCKDAFHARAKSYLELREGNLRRYGLDLERYGLLLYEQEGRCASCGHEPVGNEVLAVDHDHETDIVRGLLCDRCNRSAGLMQESPEALRALADYLERNR